MINESWYYPNHITVISPMFGVVQGPVRGGHSQRLVYLHAYGLLIVTANEQGRLSFRELVEIDLTHWKPLPLLERLGAAIDPSTALAGFHLDDVIGSLIRVPRDSEEEERGKRPLMQILLALGQEPIDARWLDPTPAARSPGRGHVDRDRQRGNGRGEQRRRHEPIYGMEKRRNQ
jgi:hypothetical protein